MGIVKGRAGWGTVRELERKERECSGSKGRVSVHAFG